MSKLTPSLLGIRIADPPATTSVPQDVSSLINMVTVMSPLVLPQQHPPSKLLLTSIHADLASISKGIDKGVASAVLEGMVDFGGDVILTDNSISD